MVTVRVGNAWACAGEATASAASEARAVRRVSMRVSRGYTGEFRSERQAGQKCILPRAPPLAPPPLAGEGGEGEATSTEQAEPPPDLPRKRGRGTSAVLGLQKATSSSVAPSSACASAS